MSHFHSIPATAPGVTARALVLGIQSHTLQSAPDAAPAPFTLPEAAAPEAAPAASPRGVERVPPASATIVVHVPPGALVPAPPFASPPLNAPPPSPPPAALPQDPAATDDPVTLPAAPPPPPAPRADAPVKRPGTVRQAIANAAQQTSVEYDYLIAQAELESGLNPRAKARTSSATGLFQFLDNTWLGTMKRHGARFGLGPIADEIQISAGGQAFVPDQGQRNAILALRNDPRIASLMAAGLAEDNRAALEPVLGRAPDHGELYLAHFLGAGGARQFLTELQRNPGASAAAVFPRPAAANRAIFYDANGTARSLAGVMELIDGKMRGALARMGEPGMIARANAPIGPQGFGGPVAAAGPATGLPNGYAGPGARLFAPDPVAGPGAAGGFAPGGFAPLSDRGAVAGATVPVNPAAFARAAGNGAGFAPAGSGPGAGAAPRISLSEMLRATFGGDGGPALASPEGAAQVKRAYAQLQAFGL